MEIPIPYLVSLYIILLGPFKVIGPFALATANADPSLRRQIANRAFVMSTIVSLLIAVLGGFVMSQLNLSAGTLSITMGFFMAHWAIGNALEKPGQTLPPTENPTISLATFPISMPGIVPPQGIALLVLSTDFIIETQSVNSIMIVIKVVLGVMILNWIFMRITPSLMKFPGPAFWKVLGRVLAVAFTAMSLQVIVFGLRNLGIIN